VGDGDGVLVGAEEEEFPAVGFPAVVNQACDVGPGEVLRSVLEAVSEDGEDNLAGAVVFLHRGDSGVERLNGAADGVEQRSGAPRNVGDGVERQDLADGHVVDGHLILIVEQHKREPGGIGGLLLVTQELVEPGNGCLAKRLHRARAVKDECDFCNFLIVYHVRSLHPATHGTPDKATVKEFLLQRLEQKARGKTKYIAPVSVLAGSRADWDLWTDWLAALPKESQPNYYDLLADCLKPLQQDFDICLIDFPGSQSRTLAKIGMRASSWWLLPDKPDWFSSGDLDVPVGVVHEAQKNSPHRIRPLGTLLNICPNRGSTSYRKARASLQRLSEDGGIPPLFSKSSEILHRPEALNALDKNSSDARTLVKRYGSTTSPFYTGLRNLTKEVLERLDEKHKAPSLSVLAKFRRNLADYWR
jgi:cellulose biosynthesis protein BcsQ